MAEPRIVVVTCMRDEGPNLVDWIAHTRAAGADEILAFTNDCSDGTDRLLDRLAAGGVVHVANRVPPGMSPQWAALGQASRHPAVAAADWIVVLDCDEYVNLRAPLDNLRDLVAVAQADAIALPWRLFGHGGHLRRPDRLAPEAYTRAIPHDAPFPPSAWFFKTLYRRRGPFERPGIHRPRQIATPVFVDGSGRALPGAVAANPARIRLAGGPLATNLVQLNHYSVRSVEDFAAKTRRGLPNHQGKPVDLGYWVERNFNDVEDASIARMAPRTASFAAALRGLQGVVEAEAAATLHHRAAFEAMLADPEGVRRVSQLVMAGSSALPPPRLAGELVALMHRAMS